jgi:integrase
MEKLPKWSVQPKPNGDLYAFFRKPWDGKQTSCALDTKDRDEALKVGNDKVRAYLEANWPDLEVATVAFWPVGKLLSRFMGKVQGENKDSTRAAVEGSIRRFMTRLAELVQVPKWEDLDLPKALTEDRFDAIMRGYKAENKAPRYRNTILIDLTSFFDFAIAQGCQVENWAAKTTRPKLEEFTNHGVCWTDKEFNTYYGAALPDERIKLTVMRYSGMDPADYFFMRRKHIVPGQGDYVVDKVREKATTPRARILLPLKYNPAREVIMKAWDATKNPEDRLFDTDYGDKSKRAWDYYWHNRRTRLWMKLFPGIDLKTYKDLRHTFVTKCVDGSLFNREIPEDTLERWVGHVPGSRMLRMYYIHRAETASLMRPKEAGLTAP